MKKTPAQSHLPSWMAVAAIVFVCLLAYHNCLNNEMFWDDDDFILKNRYIKDWKFFPQFFSENLVAGGYLLSNYWRPVLLTVFASAWHAWNTWLPGWHSLNITFHALDAVLLYFLLNRLFANRVLSVVTALLFAVHPVHNEAIVYVNSLGDSLAGFFVLSSLLLFARFRQSSKPAYASRNFWFALLFFPLALMSKETGIVLCALLPMMDFLLLNQEPLFLKRLKRTFSTIWPFVLLGITYILMRGTVLNFNNSFNFYNEQNAFTSSIVLRLLTFFKAITQYTGFLFFPHDLRVERQMPWAQGLFEWDVLLGGAIVAGMLWGIFRFWKTKPLYSFGFAWFFIAIAPASNVLVPINAVLYEHFLYMPMIGIMLVVTQKTLNIIDARKWQTISIGALVLILVIFSAVNIRRNLDWRTAINFYELLVKYAPSYRVINNLGMEYADKALHDQAEIWYTKAIAMDPINPVAYHNIGGTYRDTGRLDLAEQSFLKAIALDSNFIFSYRSLADLYFRVGQYAQAKKYIEVLINFDPGDQDARQALQATEAALAQKN